MSEWRGISTAPKDGTRVLIFDRQTQKVGLAWSSGKAWWLEDDDQLIDPTHWMPLPPPPEKENT